MFSRSSVDGLPNKARQYREMAKAIPMIKKAVAPFDGKVFNKRLNEAIETATRANKYYAYVTRNSYDMGRVYCASSANWRYTYFAFRIDNDRRIHIDDINKQLDKSYQSLMSHASDIEKFWENKETTMRNIKTQTEILYDLIHDLPDDVVSAYGLRFPDSVIY